MSNDVLFHMWRGTREWFIAEQKFYLEQASIRLLSQFENIDDEATKVADEYYEERGKNFDPDRDDEGAIAEDAYHAGGEYYLLLAAMRERTRLSVVAGMYHEWDKKIREWLVEEARHFGGRSEVAAILWRKPFNEIVRLMDGFCWNISGQSYFPKLEACDLVVNVYKHGEGISLKTLKKRFPEYLPDPLGKYGFGNYDPASAEYGYMRVTDEQIQEFSDAFVAFWQRIPERTYNSVDVNVPEWFVNALKKDVTATRKIP
jgi:hypothetical protein